LVLYYTISGKPWRRGLGTGDWAIAALELGDAAWAKDMANVIADNYTQIVLGTDPYGFEYVGWGKALKAFHAVDLTAYSDEIADIVSILTPLQQADGSFTGGFKMKPT